MRPITIIAYIHLLLISVNSYGQETKRKKVLKDQYVEEYNVLKEDKEVKQGQYVKFNKDVLDRKIPVEFGFFEKGKRAGEWYFFYPNGALESFGNYKDSEKYGLWKEYYKPPISAGESWTSYFDIQNDLKADKNGTVIVEKKDKLISAMGVYVSNKKLGTWNYYDRIGNLIHKYDNSSDTLLFSSVSDSVNKSCPYLGGIERFYRYYFEKAEEFGHETSPSESIVVLKLEVRDKPITVTRIRSTGDENAALKVEKTIKAIPDEWIKSYVKKPIFLEWGLKRDSNRISIIAEFKQINTNNL